MYSQKSSEIPPIPEVNQYKCYKYALSRSTPKTSPVSTLVTQKQEYSPGMMKVLEEPVLSVCLIVSMAAFLLIIPSSIVISIITARQATMIRTRLVISRVELIVTRVIDKTIVILDLVMIF